MEWTEQKPTELGYYWHWFDGCTVPYAIEIIWADTEGGPLAIWDDGMPGNLEHVKGWFMGPLERPEPPVKEHKA